MKKIKVRADQQEIMKMNDVEKKKKPGQKIQADSPVIS